MERRYSLICVKSLTTSSSMKGDRRIQFQNKFLNLEKPVTPIDYYIKTGSTKEQKYNQFKQLVTTKKDTKRLKRRASKTCLFCEKTCASLWHLEIHMHSHTKEQPFKCPDCGTIFSAPAALQAHRKNAHMGKTHACDMCSMTFVSYENMFAHRVNHFKKRVSTPRRNDDASKSKKIKEKTRSDLTIRRSTTQQEPVVNSKLLRKSSMTKNDDETEYKNFSDQHSNMEDDQRLEIEGDQYSYITASDASTVAGKLQEQKEEEGEDSDSTSSYHSASALSLPTTPNDDIHLQNKDFPYQLNSPDVITSCQEFTDETVIKEYHTLSDSTKEEEVHSELVSLESLSLMSNAEYNRSPDISFGLRGWSMKTAVLKPFPCAFCQTQFNRKNQLKSHLAENHRMSLMLALTVGRLD